MFRPLAIAIVLAAIAARAWLHLSTPLVQGMNGGYYLVQARSLIEKYALAIPDLPLVFTLQACLGKVVHLVSGMTLEDSVKLAVKTVDSVLPALAVIPVLLLGKAWSKGDKVDLGIIALAAVLVPAGAPALSMVGDFEKNSLGLALLCTLVWALHRWAAEPTRVRLLVAAGILGMVGITHIGVFGTTLIFAGTSLATLAVAHGKEGMIKAGKLALIAAPVVALAAGVVFLKFDPARVQKLMHAFSEPADYLGSAGGPGRGAPGMTGPPGMIPASGGWLQNGPLIAFALTSIPALLIVWWKRRSVGAANLAVITGAAVTVITLTGPWVQGDKMMRFQLNAVPLAVLCLLFALLQIPRAWARGIPGVLILIAALLPSALRLQSGPRPIITLEAYNELKSLAESVEDPANTLVVARHGLEWWTAWTLHTNIAQAQALTMEDWTKYKNVWFIEEKRGGLNMMGPFGPPGGQGRDNGKQSGPGDKGTGWARTLDQIIGFFSSSGPRPGGRGPGSDMRRNQGGPPPDMAMIPGPPSFGPGFGGPSASGPAFGRGMGPRPGGRAGGGGMMGAPIPEDAEVLHEGEHFKLAWVQQVPAFIAEREANPLDPLSALAF